MLGCVVFNGAENPAILHGVAEIVPGAVLQFHVKLLAPLKNSWGKPIVQSIARNSIVNIAVRI